MGEALSGELSCMGQILLAHMHILYVCSLVMIYLVTVVQLITKVMFATFIEWPSTCMEPVQKVPLFKQQKRCEEI